MGTTGTGGRFLQEKGTSEEVASSGSSRTSSGSGGGDGSDSGGGSVDAAHEVEVGDVEAQEGRASATDGGRESKNECIGNDEQDCDSDRYEILSDGTWSDEDQQPVRPRQVPAPVPARSPPPVGLEPPRSAQQAVAATTEAAIASVAVVMEGSVALRPEPGSASRGLVASGGDTLAEDEEHGLLRSESGLAVEGGAETETETETEGPCLGRPAAPNTRPAGGDSRPLESGGNSVGRGGGGGGGGRGGEDAEDEECHDVCFEDAGESPGDMSCDSWNGFFSDAGSENASAGPGEV
ncbi:unnamed protein product, partial [Laminaria digitata]